MGNLAEQLQDTQPELVLVGMVIKLHSGGFLRLDHTYDYMGEEKGMSMFASDKNYYRVGKTKIEGVYDHKGNQILPPLWVTPRTVTEGMGLHNYKPSREVRKIMFPVYHDRD